MCLQSFFTHKKKTSAELTKRTEAISQNMGQRKAQSQRWTSEIEAFWRHTDMSAERYGMELRVGNVCVQERQSTSSKYEICCCLKLSSPDFTLWSYFISVFHGFVQCLHCHQLNPEDFQLSYTNRIEPAWGIMHTYLWLGSPQTFSHFMETFIKAWVQQENIVCPWHYPCWGECCLLALDGTLTLHDSSHQSKKTKTFRRMPVLRNSLMEIFIPFPFYLSI